MAEGFGGMAGERWGNGGPVRPETAPVAAGARVENTIVNACHCEERVAAIERRLGEEAAVRDADEKRGARLDTWARVIVPLALSLAIAATGAALGAVNKKVDDAAEAVRTINLGGTDRGKEWVTDFKEKDAKHDQAIGALTGDVSEIKSDVKVIRTLLQGQAPR